MYGQVCPTQYQYVAPLLSKLKGVDVKRLSRSVAANQAQAGAAADAAEGGGGPAAPSQERVPPAPGSVGGAARRNDASAVSAARERYLQRRGKG